MPVVSFNEECSFTQEHIQALADSLNGTLQYYDVGNWTICLKDFTLHADSNPKTTNIYVSINNKLLVEVAKNLNAQTYTLSCRLCSKGFTTGSYLDVFTLSRALEKINSTLTCYTKALDALNTENNC